MQLKAKKIGVEKDIRFLRALFFQFFVFPVQRQAVSLFEEMSEEESNTFPDRLLCKGQDNLSADCGDIELRSLFRLESMDCETEVLERFVSPLKNIKQGGRKYLGILLAGIHNDEQILQEGMALLTSEQRGKRRELDKKEAPAEYLRKRGMRQQAHQTGGILFQGLVEGFFYLELLKNSRPVDTVQRLTETGIKKAFTCCGGVGQFQDSHGMLGNQLLRRE